MSFSFIAFNFLCIGMYLAMFASQGVNYVYTRRRSTNLILAALSFVAAIYLLISTYSHFSPEGFEGSKHLVTFYLIEMILLATAVYFQNEKRFTKLYYASSGVALLCMVINIVDHSGVIFSEDVGSYAIVLPTGENYYQSQGTNSWYFPILVLLFYSTFLTFLVKNVVYLFKSGDRSKTILLGFSLFYTAINIFDILVDFGAIQFVYLSEYSMLPLIFLLNFDVARKLKSSESAQKRLSVLQEDINTMIDEIELYVLRVNKKGEITFANSFFLSNTQYQLNEIVHMPFSSIFLTEEKKLDFDQKFSSLTDGNEFKKFDNCMVNKNGEAIHVDWNNVIIRKENGEIASILSVGVDISKRKESEKKLKGAFSEINRVKRMLEEENTFLKEILINESEQDSILVGNSDAMQYVKKSVHDIAPTDSSVLIEGETGVGKEVVAEAVYRSSSRKDQVFIKVNCGALSKDLIESELFGHEKGAFTGAQSSRKGRFEIADGGTLFLDEIGELPIDLQPKLLRVLQSGEFIKLGGEKVKKVNVRIIAATNKDLQACIQKGTFREDLYYRISVFPITVPALRRRGDDLEDLVYIFMKEFVERYNKPNLKVSLATLKKLKAYQWPGNVRELKNVLERAVIISKGNKLELGKILESTKAQSDVNRLSLEQHERNYITKVLEEHNWKVSGENSASTTLKINEGTLRSKMKKLGISKPK